MSKRIPYAPWLTGLAIVGITLIAGFLFQKPYTFHGTVIKPPLPLKDFRLPTANNQTFHLSDQQGKVVLLFFGYTSCPDVCPTTLAEFKQAYAKLGNEADKVAFVMITADPERDTPDRVANYAAFFNPAFIGLGGERADLEKIWKELGVYVEKQETNSAAGYLVDHTASVFVIDQNGNLRLMYPYGTSASDMADDLSQLLKEK